MKLLFRFSSIVVTLLTLIVTMQHSSIEAAPSKSSICVSGDRDSGVIHDVLPLEKSQSSGEFPEIADSNGEQLTYEVDSVQTPFSTSVTIDGVNLVVNGMMTDRWSSFTVLSVDETDSVINFFRQWSGCIESFDRGGMSSLFTDFGWSWINAVDDPFRVRESAASGVRYGGSLSRSVGALPLELFDAVKLRDGRVVVVNGDGSKHNDADRVLGNESEGSLWVLRPVAGSWVIDGVVGDFLATASNWFVIPTE